MQVIGQVRNLNMIDKWKQIPNFVIIQGDEHTGKTYLVKYMCDKFKKQYVKVDNSIDDVRNLIETLTTNSNSVFHFKDFDKASARAKNALLKITEETPVGNSIIITGDSQINTLESRARKIVMESYAQDDMLSFMSKYLSQDKISLYYKAGFNTPSKVLLYKDYDKLDDLLGIVNKVYEKILYLEPSDIISFINRFESKYADIDVAILFLDMLIHTINYKSKFDLPDYKFSYKNVLKILIGGKNHLLHNKSVNRKMMLYQIFFDIVVMGGSS